MKKILVPVDFSETSTNALSFAAEIARRSSAHLIITHIQQKGETEADANNKLETLTADLKTSFGGELSFETLLAEGGFISNMEQVIEAQQPGLIVMGTNGASGLKRILIGSNTVKLLAKTKVPVLVIPEVARFENFLANGKNRIVLATDLEFLENERDIDILKEIGKLIIEPKLRVLSVRPKNTELAPEKRAERRYLVSLFSPDIETERTTIFANNVISGINFYLDKNEDSGLLAMIARDSGDLIQKHYTREMASHTHLPLLVMHDRSIG